MNNYKWIKLKAYILYLYYYAENNNKYTLTNEALVFRQSAHTSEETPSLYKAPRNAINSKECVAYILVYNLPTILWSL